MKKLLNYIFYGFYQIDFILASPNDHFYHTRTGSMLFSLLVVSYIISFVNIICFFFAPFIVRLINSIEDWAMMIMALALIISLFFGFYWFRDNIYVEDFRELDKEPQYMKWVLFCASMIFGIIGVFCFIKSGFWVRDEIVKYLISETH